MSSMPHQYELALYELSDLATFVGGQAIDDRRPASRYISLSVGQRDPLLVTAFIEGTKGSITGQIGAKISLDALVQRVTTTFADAELPKVEGEGLPYRTSIVVQEGLKEANRQLYHYGTKMLSSGKIAASALVVCCDQERVSIGRTGPYDCFLLRHGRLARFFQRGNNGGFAANRLERFLGASKQILVEMASARVERGDRVVVTSLSFPDSADEVINEILVEPQSLEKATLALAVEGAKAVTEGSVRSGVAIEHNIFCAGIEVLDR